MQQVVTGIVIFVSLQIVLAGVLLGMARFEQLAESRRIRVLEDRRTSPEHRTRSEDEAA
jgi:hypothetical protein